MLTTLHAEGCQGWLVVEAERDPVVTLSYALAKQGHDALRAIVRRLGGA